MSKKVSINNKLKQLEGKITANTIRNTRDMALKYPRGEDGLTDKQRIFVSIYTENEGRLTPTECARQSGYKTERAATTASELLNNKKYEYQNSFGRRPVGRSVRNNQKSI